MALSRMVLSIMTLIFIEVTLGKTYSYFIVELSVYMLDVVMLRVAMISGI